MTRARVYQATALIIRQRDLGEADRILTLYTPERGKLSAVGKAVRRPRSKLAGSLQLFTLAELQLAAGRTLDLVTQAHALNTFYQLRQDLPRYTHACYAAELLDALIEDGQSDQNLFTLAVETLTALEAGADPATIIHAFELQLLAHLGYGPELNVCTVCGGEDEQSLVGFAVSQGGVVCRSCTSKTAQLRLSPNGLRAMRDLRTTELAALQGRRLSPEAAAEVGLLLQGFIGYQLDRPLRSPSLLTTISPSDKQL
jgi:DNA repair protein RecO (recombination protein O)